MPHRHSACSKRGGIGWHGATGGRCVHNKRLKRYSWKCPMAAVSSVQVYQAAVRDKCGCLVPDFGRPPPQISLCNRLCPLRRFTLTCPWNSWDLAGADCFTRRLWGTLSSQTAAGTETVRGIAEFEPSALSPCSCGLRFAFVDGGDIPI